MPQVRQYAERGDEIRHRAVTHPQPTEPVIGERPAHIAYRVPFNRPFVTGREVKAMIRSVNSGRTCGDGPFTTRCQEFLERRFRACQVLLTTSCTAALEMAALLIDLKPGDEVILPSYTFVSTANAFLLRGASPVFVDVRPDTLNMDERLVEAAITERTRAIVPVHYAGVSCEMDEIVAIARKYGLYVIEDAAQGVDAKYKNAYLGTIGDLGTYSFHETKNISCGEGGALVSNNPRFIERAEFIREKGTNRSNFFRGKVSKYSWIDIGSSYALSDILAALLWEQLNSVDIIKEKRRTAFELYREALQPLADRGLLRLPCIPQHCDANYHMFYVILQNQEIRTTVIRHLQTNGIQAIFHFVPLHTSPMGISLGYREGMLPVTEELSRRLLRLPFHCTLSERDVHAVATGLSHALLG